MEWRKIVSAIETSLPIYDSVSERISFNKAESARKTGAEYLATLRNGWVADVGVGPGTSTRLMLEKGFGSIVGVDPSMKLLRHSKDLLPADRFYPVLAVAEHLPLRDGGLDGVLTCFALRDSLDSEAALGEFGRVVRPGGRFAVVDIGKPGKRLERLCVSLYVRLGMPLLSSVLVWGRVEGNPFRMIVPTYKRLVSNEVLRDRIGRIFGTGELRTIMMGGLIVITAEQKGSESMRGER